MSAVKVYSKEVDDEVDKIVEKEFAERPTSSVDTDELEVDSAVHNQEWVCVSFCTKPLDKLADFEAFRMAHFLANCDTNEILEMAGKQASESSNTETKKEPTKEEVHDKLFGAEMENLNHRGPVKLREDKEFEQVYQNVLHKYKRFVGEHRVYFNNRFRDLYGSVWIDRAVKVRGSYKNLTKANARVKELKQEDPRFPVFIGQVGRWLPYDPDPMTSEEYKTNDKKLNELIAGYKVEQEKAKRAFGLRKELLMRQAAKRNEELKAIQQEQQRKYLETGEEPEEKEKRPLALEGTKGAELKNLTEEEYEELIKDPNVKNLGEVIPNRNAGVPLSKD